MTRISFLCRTVLAPALFAVTGIASAPCVEFQLID
jgi:hypothetical protein